MRRAREPVDEDPSSADDHSHAPPPRAIIPRHLSLHESADVQVTMDIYALQGQFGAMLRLCDAILQPSSSSAASSTLRPSSSNTAFHGRIRFCRAYALSRTGESAQALQELALLKGDAFALPVTALSRAIHSAAKVRDQTLLSTLKTQLKIVSKQHTSPHSLLLAARYFLWTGAIEKARQCIAKRVRSQPDAEGLNLLAMMEVRSIQNEDVGGGGSKDATTMESEPQEDRLKHLERSRRITRKAIKLAHMAANDAAEAADTSDGDEATVQPSVDLLLSAYTRLVQASLAPNMDHSKSLRELTHLLHLFPRFLPAIEWRAKMLLHAAVSGRDGGAAGEWKEGREECERELQVLKQHGGTKSHEKHNTEEKLQLSSHSQHPLPSEPLIETDSIALRWFLALDVLLHSATLSTSPTAVLPDIQAYHSAVLALEGKNWRTLSSAARNLIHLSRGDPAVLSLASTLLDRAMLFHRKSIPSDHAGMSRLLCLQSTLHLLRCDPAEALESGIEAFVMDESGAVPVMGQVDALIRLERYNEAEKLLRTLPEEPPSVSPAGAEQPKEFLRCFLQAQLALAATTPDFSLIVHLLSTALSSHLTLRSRSPPHSSFLDDCSSGSSHYWESSQAEQLIRLGEVYLRVIGEGWKKEHGSTSSSAHEIHIDSILAPLLTILSSLAAIQRAHAPLLLLVSQLHCVRRDFGQARKYAQACSSLRKQAMAEEKKLKVTTGEISDEKYSSLSPPSSTSSSAASSPRHAKITLGLTELAKLLKTAGPGLSAPSSTEMQARRLNGGGVGSNENTLVSSDASLVPSITLSSDSEDDLTAIGSPPHGGRKLDDKSRSDALRKHRKAVSEREAEAEYNNVLSKAERLSTQQRLEAEELRREEERARKEKDDERTRLVELEVQEALGSRQRRRRKKQSTEAKPQQFMRSEDLVPASSLRCSDGGVGGELGHSSSGSSISVMTHSRSTSVASLSLNGPAAYSRNGSAASLTAAANGGSAGFSRNGSTASLGGGGGGAQSSFLSHYTHVRGGSAGGGLILGGSSSETKLGSVVPLTHAMPSSASMSSLDGGTGNQVARVSPGVFSTPSSSPSTSPLHTTFEHVQMAWNQKPVVVPASERQHAMKVNHQGAPVKATPLPPSQPPPRPAQPPRSVESTVLAAKKAALAASADSLARYERFLLVAAHGATFWKHGRKGDAHQRTVKITVAQTKVPSPRSLSSQIHIPSPRENSARPSPRSTSSSQPHLQLQQGKSPRSVEGWSDAKEAHHSGSGSAAAALCQDELRIDWGTDKLTIPLPDFHLLPGKQTDVFARSSASRSKPELCFSLVGRTRTLDLEAPSRDLARVWIDGLLHVREHCMKTAAADAANWTAQAAQGEGRTQVGSSSSHLQAFTTLRRDSTESDSSVGSTGSFFSGAKSSGGVTVGAPTGGAFKRSPR